MTVLLNRLRGVVRDHLLLNADMDNPDYNGTIKTVEEYYSNVYIGNEQGDLNAFKGKCNYSKEGNMKVRRRNERTTRLQQRMQQRQKKRPTHKVTTIL
eukprot:5585649-Amphidinium_carterae.1